MLIKKEYFYSFSTLSKYKNILCLVTTTKFGDAREEKIIGRVVEKANISNDSLVKAHQVHGSKVIVVTQKNKNNIRDDCDGLITSDQSIFLMVLIADCLPIVAFDPKREIVGIAHAGWQGTVKNISEKLVFKFKELGSKVEDILVEFGPCIESCHYGVEDDRILKIKNAGLTNSLINISGRIFFDLKKANLYQLIKSGILKKNISISLRNCTYENNEFYSWCREKPNLSGNFATIIGLKNGK